MQTLPQAASTPPADSKAENRRARPVEDVVYQLVTVGAILLVLGSLWLF
jgi:hypothetical protein